MSHVTRITVVACLVAVLQCAPAVGARAAAATPPGTAFGVQPHDRDWTGEVRFQDNFCVVFPHAADVVASELRLEHASGAIVASRAVYGDNAVVVVVTSTLPDARTPAQEIAEQRARITAAEARIVAVGGRASHRDIETAFGPGLAIRYQDIDLVDEAGGAFPVALPLLAPAPVPRSASAHRVVVRGGSRYEIAAWVKTAADGGDRAFEAAAGRAESLADATLASFLRCTATLPVAPVIPR